MASSSSSDPQDDFKTAFRDAFVAGFQVATKYLKQQRDNAVRRDIGSSHCPMQLFEQVNNDYINAATETGSLMTGALQNVFDFTFEELKIDVQRMNSLNLYHEPSRLPDKRRFPPAGEEILGEAIHRHVKEPLKAIAAHRDETLKVEAVKRPDLSRLHSEIMESCKLESLHLLREAKDVLQRAVIEASEKIDSTVNKSIQDFLTGSDGFCTHFIDLTQPSGVFCSECTSEIKGEAYVFEECGCVSDNSFLAESVADGLVRLGYMCRLREHNGV
jgi:hypothetical protein